MMKGAVVIVAGLALLGIDGVVVARVGGDPGARGRSLEGAESAVASYLSSMSALWDSGGDPRVAERVPAVPDLVSESLAAMAFAERRLQLSERHQLIRMEREGSRWLPDGRAEIRTREFWVYRFAPRDGSASPSTRSFVCRVRYELLLEGPSWRVVDFRLDEGRESLGGEGR